MDRVTFLMSKINFDIRRFDIDKKFIGINEIFVAKYSPNGQNKLSEHEDGSELSFVMALNDEYTGGGTYFTKLKQKVLLPKGWSCSLGEKHTKD